jgi:membrane protease YdiL (CAAX protease family)
MYIQNAEYGKNQWWRFPLMLIALFFGASLLFGFLTVPYESLKHAIELFGKEQLTSAQIEAEGVSLNVFLFLFLTIFACALVVMAVIFPYIHLRSFHSLVNNEVPFRFGRFFFGLALMLVLNGVFEAWDFWAHPQDFVWQFDPVKFLPLVLISLSMLPMQTGFEEVLVRGYFAQSLFLLIRRPWVVILATSLIFGLMHNDNPEVKAFGFWQMMPFYVLPGLLWGIVSNMDEGLELTMGLHFGTNLFNALFATYDQSALQTYALFSLKNIEISWVNYLWELVVFAVVLASSAWLFSWSDWGKLLRPVPKLVFATPIMEEDTDDEEE